MKKVILTAMLAFAMFAGANAQFKLGANFGVQMPMGDFGDVASTGFGGGITAEYLVTENIGVGLNAGYYSFGEAIEGYKFSTIPVAVQGRYYFITEGFKPYAGIDLGLYSLTYKVSMGGMFEDAFGGFGNTMEDLGSMVGAEEGLGNMMGDMMSGMMEGMMDSMMPDEVKETKTYFGLAPVIGCQYDFTDALALDLNVKYNYIMSNAEDTGMDGIGSFGINVGIVYTFGN